jgi:hypothetical protein
MKILINNRDITHTLKSNKIIFFSIVHYSQDFLDLI